MKQTVFILMAIAILSSCSGGSTPSPTSTSSMSPCGNYLLRRFPHLDTATLWYYNGAIRTRSYAKFTAGGYINVTSTTPSQSGNYYACVSDTIGNGGQLYTFFVNRTPVDTPICDDNNFEIITTSSRPYMILFLGNGNLPATQILSGYFIDSL